MTSDQRRLAAILVADVVGYSKLMGSDEAGTLAQLEALRREIIEPNIAKHAGRLFKSARQSVQHNPNYRGGWTSLAATAAATGRDTVARAAAVRVLELMPTFTVQGWARLHPIDAGDKFEPIIQSLRLAGLPE